MKNLLAGLVIGAVVCFGWSFYRNQKNETTLPVTIEFPTPAASPASTPIVIQDQPTPAATSVKHLASKGVFFVIERISTMTDSGVASAVPGTRVTLVRDGSPMRVTDGQHEYDATPFQLTDDMDIAAQVAQADHSAQAKLNQAILLKIQEYQKPQPEQKAKAEEMSRARVLRQQKIDRVRQQIKDARQAIYENKCGGMVPSPLFDNSTRVDREEQRKYILNKEKEVRDLQSELDGIESNGTVK